MGLSSSLFLTLYKYTTYLAYLFNSIALLFFLLPKLKHIGLLGYTVYRRKQQKLLLNHRLAAMA